LKERKAFDRIAIFIVNLKPRRQSFVVCDFPDEQIIVNERCNLIIQYLEKQSRDYFSVYNQAAKKRDINNVMNKCDDDEDTTTQNKTSTSSRNHSNQSINTNSNQPIAKYLKRRRVSQQDYDNSNSISIDENIDDLIEIDDDNDGNDDENSVNGPTSMIINENDNEIIDI